MYKRSQSKYLLALATLLLYSPFCLANEVDKILSGAGTVIIFFMVLFALSIFMLVFIFVKNGLKRFIILSVINGLIFLLIYTKTDAMDYLILDQSFIFDFQLLFQFFFTVFTLPKYFLGKKTEKLDKA